MGGASGSSGKPGFPPAFDYLAGLVGGGEPGFGLPLDLIYSHGGYNQASPLTAQNLFGDNSLFAQNFGNLNQQGFLGGDMLRQLGAQGTNQAFGNAQQLAAQQAALAGGLAGMNPADFLSASASFGRGINQGLNTFGSTIGSAQQALADVMDPTSQNSLFENAANLLTPRVRAAFSARGLGSSGSAIEEEGNQLQQLADSFALRQAQERQAALGTLGSLAQGQGGLGVAGAQVPGQVFNQLAQGGNLQQQALLAAQQGNLAPLQALQAGGGVFQQGLDMPLSNFNNLLALRNQPMSMITPLLGGISGTKSGTQFLSSLGIPKG
jgi:hypothetical protein